MATNNQQNMWANSTIPCSTIVIRDATHFNAVKTAAAATTVPVGISTNAVRTRPDPDFSQSTQAQQIAAIAGESVLIYPQGCTGVDLVCGSVPWAAGDPIMSDANGFGITATSGNYYIGFAQTTGVAGALGAVDIQIGKL